MQTLHRGAWTWPAVGFLAGAVCLALAQPATGQGLPEPGTMATSPDTVQGPRGPGSPAAPSPAAPSQAVFDTLASAWQRGDARALLRVFGEGPVTLRLSDQEPGPFSRGQCALILERLFESTATQEFRLSNSQESGPVAVGLAHWTSRNRRNGSLTQERVIVVLERGANGWVVTEIQVVK